MSTVSIRASGLSKRYRIGERFLPYRTLRDSLAGAFGRRPSTRAPSPHGDHIWALRNVSFEIERGTAVGIIGANGAGKSTLLKILSRITEPTEGLAVIHGRVGSLLEVGTGFHPELTGRENIFLNGAILGMRRAEIVKRFDEIIAFAEIEKFVDTPVKHYSTGMYTRIAFAVAAHLDYEVLLVDEVLAVGDPGFQRKCLSKMDDVSHEGRTVLLVSHNMSAIGMLTRTCFWLDEGRIVGRGDTKAVLRNYMERPFHDAHPLTGKQRGYVDLSGQECRRGVAKALVKEAVFRSVRLLDYEGRTTDTFFERGSITLEITIAALAPLRDVEVICLLRSAENSPIFTAMSGQRDLGESPGTFGISCVFSPNPLRPGWYRVELHLVSGANVPQDQVKNDIMFHVIGDVATADNPRYAQNLLGVIRVDYPWSGIKPLVDT